MATHGAFPQVFYSGSWQNVTTEVEADTITIQRGMTDRGELRPAKLAWTFLSDNDKWRPTNPTSPIYGVAGRNTSVAVAVDSSVRATCQATSWRPDQSIDFTVSPARGRRWVELEAYGLLARIGRWNDVLRSPLYRQIISYGANLLGHWPLEDSSAATQLTNTVSRGSAGAFTGVNLASAAGPAGAGDAVKMTSGGIIRGTFITDSTSGWQVSWSQKLAAIPAAEFETFRWYTANGWTWSWKINATQYVIQATDLTGANVVNIASAFGAGTEPNQWVAFRVKVSVSGGTVSVEPAWYPQGAGVAYGFTTTYAATNTSALSRWQISSNANTDNALFSHVFGVKTVADDLQSYNAKRAFDGYAGEVAADRFTRLCSQVGIARSIVGTASDTAAMGPQKPDTFLNLIKECMKTDDGMIFDQGGNLGLIFRTRVSLYNQTAKIALTWPTHIAPPFDEKIDDEGVRNQVTVKQRDGGEATAELTTGPLSTASPPSGVGLYKDTVDVNVAAESTLAGLAGWWLNRGTAQGLAGRYPQVTLDLDGAANGLITSINSVDIGDRITVTGREPDPIGMIVLGIDESVGTHRRKVTFTCIRDTVYNPGKYDATTARYDMDSLLTNAPTTTSTSWAISSTDAAGWSTTAVPYDWQCGGERVTVTAITAVAGTGPYTQTATVTRSVNGVIKAHSIGEALSLADPTRYAL